MRSLCRSTVTVTESSLSFRHGAAWQRVEGRRALLFLAAAGLVTWVQLGTGPVRFGPLVLALGLVVGDLVATMWASWRVEVVAVSGPVPLDDDVVVNLDFNARSPFVIDTLEVLGSHDLDTSIGCLDEPVVATDQSVRARCDVGQPDAITAITLNVRCRTLGLFSIDRAHAVVLEAPPSIFADAARVAQVSSQGDDRVRAYRTGDARNRIHWPVTARTGELHVRAVDTQGFEQLTIVVEVADDEVRRDVLRRAFDQVSTAMASGRLVRLVTFEVSQRERGNAVERLLADPGRRRSAANLQRSLTAAVVEGLVHDREALVGRLCGCRPGMVRSFGPDEVRIA